MKISRGDGFHDLVIDFEDGDSQQLQFLMTVILPEVLAKFSEKNRGYKSAKGANYTLGAKGEFAEIFRKTGKLHLGVWDGDKDAFKSESREEVVMDMIGHCLLMLEAFSMDDVL